MGEKAISLDCASGGYRLNAHLRLPSSVLKPGFVILCHGFTNDHLTCPLLPESCDALLVDGVAAVTFDHRGSGLSEGGFRDKTLSGLRADLDAVHKAALATGLVDPERVGFWGRSFGGSLALLGVAAAKAQGCFAAAPVLGFAAFFDKFWVKGAEYSPIPEALTRRAIKGPSELNERFFEELEAVDRELQALEGLSGVLLAHGQSDQKVPFQGSQAFLARQTKPKKLLDCGEAGHDFEGAEEMVVAEMRRWLLRRLAGS